MRNDRWWGLVRPEWLRPQGGRPLSWNEYVLNINTAKNFHQRIRGQYHGTSYVYYGADPNVASFERVQWEMKQGLAPDRAVRPTGQQVRDMGFGDVRDSGSNPLYVGGQTEYVPNHGGDMWGGGAPSTYETSYWEISAAKQDGGGDGTVPTSSGRAPLLTAGSPGSIGQQFRMGGFEHEPSYKNEQTRFATLFSIQKIAASARLAT